MSGRTENGAAFAPAASLPIGAPDRPRERDWSRHPIFKSNISWSG